MADHSAESDQRARWRQEVTTGDIPNDFLSVSDGGGVETGGHTNSALTDDTNGQLPPQPIPDGPVYPNLPQSTDHPGYHPPPEVPLDEREQQILNDEATARALAASEMPAAGYSPAVIQGRLAITVAQAKLAKNYGLMKMDPYCRIRVGHSVIEIPTCANGSKNPRWNKVVHAYLPVGVDTFHLEIYDEKLFAMDDKIAWAHINIPRPVMEGQTVDDWYPLTGRQGDYKEGMVNLIMTFSKDVLPPPNRFQPGMVMYNAPIYYPPPTGGPVQEPVGPLYTDEDVKNVQEMFPDLDDEVIRSVLDSHNGNKDACCTTLLTMSSDN